jgi:hypothetical protein
MKKIEKYSHAPKIIRRGSCLPLEVRIHSTFISCPAN